jgi:hypothetical protein
MSDAPEGWRREVEDVLAEIVADPESRLLRVPQADNLLGLADELPLSVQAPSLTKAERYLLQTHRQELAFLLRERCVMDLCSDPTDWRWPTRMTVDRDLPVASTNDWERRARVARATLVDEPRSRDAMALLDECARSERPKRINVTGLALASHRVAPSAEAQIYVAADQINDGRWDSARHLLHGILEKVRSERMRAYCWENVGLSLFLERRYPEAADAYRRATLADDALVAPPLNWFACALVVRDRGQAAEAARFAEMSVPSTHQAVDDTIAACRACAPSVDRVVMEPTGETTRRIIDALCS